MNGAAAGVQGEGGGAVVWERSGDDSFHASGSHCSSESNNTALILCEADVSGELLYEEGDDEYHEVIVDDDE